MDHRNAHQHAAQTRRANVRKERNLARSANYIFHATHHHHFACVCVGGGGRGETGPKALNSGESEKTQRLTLAMHSEHRGIPATVLDHRPSLARRLSFSWSLRDCGAARLKLIVVCKTSFSIKETTQVFYRGFSECNPVDILGLHDP